MTLRKLRRIYDTSQFKIDHGGWVGYAVGGNIETGGQTYKYTPKNYLPTFLL